MQGSELDLLMAAPRTLQERTVAIISEVSFVEIYENQPRFSDLEQFLRKAGFSFYGFMETQGWSQKYIDKCKIIGRERLCFGDAVFFKDPKDTVTNLSGIRQYAMLYLCALLLGYYDFAVELAVDGDFSVEETARLIRLAQRVGEKTGEATIQEIQELLSRMNADPTQANLQLCSFINKYRHFADVADAALPRRIPVPHARASSLSNNNV
ncbi:hypothetical protein CCP3SC5AM1_150003 [Gammaproteobacteria bacterium]